ncbi:MULTISPECIES: LuxR C-terminal-related transcriptional regulator [Clostridium]|uniref:HTH-type transcriptional regulator MalT n=4 Tax=Clostridium sporogenes TaxID=1509 RepID=A0A7U4LMZ5_CLOSG|nr:MULTISPECIES: LuxR C-terminal-related transcriptional regulator [Clostridium]AJD29479.1 bacterial regulatory s, luxR family protein [Clostridium botulinum Prevot_594]AKC62309.1 HTH-type transcriptional regulator MalT [Clostridium sporogenes]AKJ89586.1 LuxR family transcriptional regulator [Clostridium sporogenes]KCZ69618.1 HTH-type transcriptional regulator MalT [Clostridium sporogenes]KRU46697.1 LuxR family transcriptional regulator [Clostridium sporogenes]
MDNKVNLIRTKLISPMPRKNYVKREKIIKELEDIEDYKVTIIKGAAGSGKSTLLSSFIKDKDLSNVNWISLDKENNQWKSFWYYLIEILKKYLEDNGKELTNTFNAFIRKDEIFNVIPYIVNELSKKEDIFIVFDDFHYIRDEFLNSTLEYLIKYSSTNMHYIFLSREELSLYLGELRLQGQLLEIEEKNLRFSKEECLNFIKNTLNIELTEDTIDKIFNVSEGWIAGIQLIALALKGRKNNMFSGISVLNKYVIEYLTEEILKQLSEEEINFLVKTSILNYFNIELCNDILNVENAEEIINSLIDKNLFVIIIDEERKIYRYHHLFKEFLNLTFSKVSKDEQIKIHLKAYEILKKQGDIEECIKHLLEIKVYDKVLIEIENNSENIEVWSYLKDIPIEYLITSKELTLQRLFYHFVNLEVNECKNLIDILDNRIKEREWFEVINAFKIYIYDSSLDAKLNLQYIEKFNFSEITKAIIYLNSCYIFFAQGYLDKAIYYLDKSNNIGEKYNISYISFFSKSIKACALEELGELYKAECILNKVKEMLDKNPILSNLRFMYNLGIAGIYMKRFEIQKSEEELNLTSDFLCDGYEFADRGILYNFMEFQFLKGDKEKGKELANKLITIYTTNGKEVLLYLYSARIKYFISTDIYLNENLQEYKALFERQQKNSNTYIRIDEKITYARVISILGEQEKAKDILYKCLEYSRKKLLKIYLVDGLLVLTLILEKLNENKRNIFNLLREAIYYSIDNRYLKPYVLEGEKLLNIIKKLKNDKDIELTPKENNFIKNLINIMEPEKAKGELLTEREKEVLEILLKGASNKQIGERLNISLATVKTHMINIYSKLQVSNRVQAVEKYKIIKTSKY